MARRFLSATYDEWTGELTDVMVSAAFQEETGLLQADVLQDLLRVVDTLYGKARDQMVRDVDAARPFLRQQTPES